MSGISLTASMRSNLLSLQNISGQVSSTQNKLSTGKKVNSAIDNPGSYYTALSLNNRADDLNALLDSMGQAVSTIKAATTALESATEFLEQAKAVANQALETMSSPQEDTPEEDYGDFVGVSTKAELLAALQDDSIDKIMITKSMVFNKNESIVVGAGKILSGVSTNVSLSFSSDQSGFSALTLADDAVLQNIRIDYEQTKESQYQYNEGIAVTGGTLDGTVYISATGGGVTGLYGTVINGTANLNVSGDDSCAVSGNVGNGTRSVINGQINTVFSGVNTELFSCVLFCTDINGEVNIVTRERDTEIFEEVNINGSAKVKIVANSNNTWLNVNFSSSSELWYGYYTGRGVMSQYIITDDLTNINDITELSSYKTLESEKTDTFKSEIEAIVYGTAANQANRANVLLDNADIGTAQDQSSFAQYQEILNQYDALIKDAGYKGINLLQTDKLSVKFNEENTAALEVRGKDMSTQALGFKTFEWQSQGDINKSIEELSSAINAIRNYSSELGNNYNIITTRQDFTESLINVLTEGADKLTLADMNEESANMLALQTRQQLAINSLSLASQASQSILKLF